MIEIEKGVPIPPVGSRHIVKQRSPSPLTEAMAKMAPGDSFLTDKTLQAISAAAIRTGAHVTSRREGSMYRVWRTA